MFSLRFLTQSQFNILNVETYSFPCSFLRILAGVTVAVVWVYWMMGCWDMGWSTEVIGVVVEKSNLWILFYWRRFLPIKRAFSSIKIEWRQVLLLVILVSTASRSQRTLPIRLKVVYWSLVNAQNVIIFVIGATLIDIKNVFNRFMLI